MERAVYYLSHIEELYQAASSVLKQRFLREVLEEVRIRDRGVLALATPRWPICPSLPRIDWRGEEIPPT